MHKALYTLMALIATATPVLSQATVAWSSCQTITGVTNQPVGSNILVSLSPGISGCSSQGVAGAITFSAGQLGLAASDLNGLLASSLSALALGRQVLIAVDTSTPNCYASLSPSVATMGSVRRVRGHSCTRTPI